MRVLRSSSTHPAGSLFPFLFGGTFIEGVFNLHDLVTRDDFPSFSEGLSLRVIEKTSKCYNRARFPFLFGGTFIEGMAEIEGEGN